MSTTLPLFWNLSSASKEERINASVELISSLQTFQTQFKSQETSDEEGESSASNELDKLNALDVSYAIRRLARGLASPRESSRLGFAVALTELLSRLNTVTCAQIIQIIVDSSEPQGSMSGQEVRDVLFARLFGLLAVIRSGLLFRQETLPNSSKSASSLGSYRDVIKHLMGLGEKKSWLRESAWWTIGVAVDALTTSNVPWKEDAVDATYQYIFAEEVSWSPEKVALTAKLQPLHPSRPWRTLLRPTFKHHDLLNTANLSSLSKILKESSSEEADSAETRLKTAPPGTWKPQVHFVWDFLLDAFLAGPGAYPASNASLPEFFRIVVDESLFSSSASPTRKYWGFQVFQKALAHRSMTADKLSMLFTKNFMRCWINQLAGKDRLLNKIAKQVASSIPPLVQQNPTLGFALILQLTGVNGSHQFDKLTRTKTIESILSAMDTQGILKYIEWLLEQVNDAHDSGNDVQALATRRLWIVDQLSSLIRNGAIPKDDSWVMIVLQWLAVHGLFLIKKAKSKSPFLAPRAVPNPPFADDFRKLCRLRLLACLADLTSHVTVVKKEDKITKIPGVASDGAFWISKTLDFINQLQSDSRHLSILIDKDEDREKVRQKVLDALKSLNVTGREARGIQLLFSASLMQQYCADDSEVPDVDSIEACTASAYQMLNEPDLTSNSSWKAKGVDQETVPIDVIVDMIIGFLEKSTAYLRAVANQVFALLSGILQDSTVDLILAQLERRSPTADEESGDDPMDIKGGIEGGTEETSSQDGGDHPSKRDYERSDDNFDLHTPSPAREEVSLSKEDLSTTSADDDDSGEEEVMDDEQMMAIDEQLADLCKSRAMENKSSRDANAQREATHFKIRVLDLVDLLVKHQPTSPHIVRLILPLVELISGTGNNERQLSDKARGILTSRITKLKQIPPSFDTNYATTVLGEMHSRARKTRNMELAEMLSHCSLFLARLLFHSQMDQPVLQIYEESLTDYATRKGCGLNPNFVQIFIRKYPSHGWKLRDAIIDASTKSINAFRKCQTLHLFDAILRQLPMNSECQKEVAAFMPALLRTLLTTMSNACDQTGTMSTPQMKDLFKLGLIAVHQTKRLIGPEATSRIWHSSEWEAINTRLSTSNQFKASTALRTMCQQIARASELRSTVVISQAGGNDNADTNTVKRKAAEPGEDDIGRASPKKVKRKKNKDTL